MTRLIADNLKLQLKAFDHRLDTEIVKDSTPNRYMLVITTTVYVQYVLDKLLELAQGKAYFIRPNEEMRGYIDFVIY